VDDYTPEHGDCVRLEIETVRKAFLVLSPLEYNRKTGRVIACPITQEIKGYPFEVLINSKHISGAVLSDQVQCLTWRDRNAYFICPCERDALMFVLEKIGVLLNIV
jgi:mRNA interferase MazF